MSLNMDEEEIDFRVEAQGVIKDIGFAVESIEVSKHLTSSKECVHLNIVTKEIVPYCIELCVQGFRVVGNTLDTSEESHHGPFYETIYALLDNISPLYTQMFGNELVKKLSELKEKTES